MTSHVELKEAPNQLLSGHTLEPPILPRHTLKTPLNKPDLANPTTALALFTTILDTPSKTPTTSDKRIGTATADASLGDKSHHSKKH